MKEGLRLGLIAAALVVLCAGYQSYDLRAAEKLGKLFLKAGTAMLDGKEVIDSQLQDTVKDMKARRGNFILVDDEAQADFLLVVLTRSSSMMSPAGTPINHRTITASFSVRDGSGWKPICKLANPEKAFSGDSWGIAAGAVIKEAEKCVAAYKAK